MICRLQTSMRLCPLRLLGCNGGTTEQMCLPCLSLSSTSTPRSTGTGVSSCDWYSSDRLTWLSQTQQVYEIQAHTVKYHAFCLGRAAFVQ